MGIVERKEREKERRRSEIINAAEKLIFKNGFEHITVEAVAQEAEVSKATVYLYFKNKEDLLFEIFCRAHELFYSMLDKELSETDDSRTNVASFLKAAVLFKKEHSDYFNIIFYFMTTEMKVDTKNPGYKEHCDVDQFYLNKWVKLIEKAKADGFMRSDMEAMPTMFILWLQLIGFLKMISVQMPIFEQEYGITEQTIFEEYLNLILYGTLYNKN
jgi:TetR/AcrR family transcriptional regulator